MKILLFLVAATLVADRPASGLTIVGHFTGGSPPPNTIGTGNLPDLFDAWARRAELAVKDDHILTLYYGWGPLSPGATGGLAGVYMSFGTQNGREVAGQIIIDNDGSHSTEFWLDPTPYRNEEFGDLRRDVADYGGGPVVAVNAFALAQGEAFGRLDVGTLLGHEMFHALGLSTAMPNWPAESEDQGIEITAPRPYAGTVIPLTHNCCEVLPHLNTIGGALMSGVQPSERRLPSWLDVLAVAQMSDWRELNLDMRPALIVERGRIYWPAIAQEYRLQVSAGLGEPWADVGFSHLQTGGRCMAEFEPLGGKRFWRLQKGP